MTNIDTIDWSECRSPIPARMWRGTLDLGERLCWINVTVSLSPVCRELSLDGLYYEFLETGAPALVSAFQYSWSPSDDLSAERISPTCELPKALKESLKFLARAMWDQKTIDKVEYPQGATRRESTSSLCATEMNRILDAIDAGTATGERWNGDIHAENWVGSCIASITGKQKDKVFLETLIDALTTSGFLAIEQAHDATDRKGSHVVVKDRFSGVIKEGQGRNTLH